MRQVTATEKYRAVLEGKMAKREFVRQMKQTYPMFISQYNGFDDTVQILKNRQMIFEAPKPAFSGVKVYDDRPALTYSLDALDRGIRIELNAMGIDVASSSIKPEEFKQAEKKAKDNLEKDANHYLNLMAGESNKVDKHDKEKEVKRGAADKDTFNDMKKATLKEGMYTDDEEWEKEMGRTPEDTEKEIDKEASKIKEEDKYDREDGDGHVGTNTDADFEREQRNQLAGRNESMSLEEKKDIMVQVVDALRAKYPDITGSILKDFIRTHYEDIIGGADIESEFEEYIYANYETASDFREAKGKDHDGDGDIDSDDYMAAKDKAIKKAMGKDVDELNISKSKMDKLHKDGEVEIDGEKITAKEEQLKEAIKSIIKKTLLNEAATVKLADWAESYETFPGVKPVVNELENIVTEIETFYDKMGDKIKNVFEKTADFENEEGLKIGGFIAPGLESAFRQDLSKVIKKGSFFSKINLPKVRTITQADVDAHNSGERPLGETDIIEEPKTTVFTPNF